MQTTAVRRTCSRSRRCFEPCRGSLNWTSASLERVAAAGELAEVGAGDVLFREGALPESLYVLLDGKVSLTGTAARCIEHGDRHPRASQQLRAGECARRTNPI